MDKRIGKRISTLLAKKGMTPHAFAVKNGLNVGTVTDLAASKRLPKYETLCKIADALEVDVMDLLEDSEYEKDSHDEFIQIIRERTKQYDETYRGRVIGYVDCLNEELRQNKQKILPATPKDVMI